MSKVTAQDILAAIRHKHHRDPVIREMVLEDQMVLAERRRWNIDNRPDSPWYEEHYARRGDLVSDPLPSGYDPRTVAPRRRIDALLVESGLQLTAFEIKVSRADFRRDTEVKRRVWRQVTHRFIYATPAGLIDPSDIPDGCGLWEFDPHMFDARSPSRHGLTVAVRAKKNPRPQPFPEQLITALAYRVSKSEQGETRR